MIAFFEWFLLSTDYLSVISPFLVIKFFFSSNQATKPNILQSRSKVVLMSDREENNFQFYEITYI